MTSNPQPAQCNYLSFSKERKGKQRTEHIWVHDNPGSYKEAFILNSQKLGSMDQHDQGPYQYNLQAFGQPAIDGGVLGSPETCGYNGQHGQGQERNQQQLGQVADRIQDFEQQIMKLHKQLDQVRMQNEYYKRKSMEFYMKLCMRDPAVLAECRRRAEANQLNNAATNAASRPSTPNFSAIVSPVLRSSASPFSAAVPSVFEPSAPLCSTKVSAITHQPDLHSTPVPSVAPSSVPRQIAGPSVIASSVPRQTAVTSVTPSSVPRQTAVTHSSAPRQTAVPSVTPLSAPLGQASPIAASSILVDLTSEKTPPNCPSNSLKRKRAPEEPEQESEEGFELRRKILAKSFNWMKPKDRPNFQTKNPYQLEPTSFDTDSHQYNNDLGQASQKRPSAQNQPPAHPTAAAKLPSPPQNNHSKSLPRNRKRQENAISQRQKEARDRLKTKKKQINLEQDAATAEGTQDQEADDDEAGEETEAELEKEAEDVDKMAEEMENWLEQSPSK